MSKFDLGLSNTYLKFAVALLLFGVVSIAVSLLLEAPGFAQQLGRMLLVTGIVVYVMGRIAKAVSSSGK